MKNYPTCSVCKIKLGDYKSKTCIIHRPKIRGPHLESTRQKLRDARARRSKEFGYINSPEAREKIRLGNLGKKLSDETKLKMSLTRKGRIVSENVRKNMSLARKKLGIEYREKLSKSLLGHKVSDEIRRKISEANIGRVQTEDERRRRGSPGARNASWKGGVTPINKLIRHSIDYKLWREAVFKRDNYQCVIGGIEHGNKLHADHIKSFSEYPNLRFDVSNGRTLCKKCHEQTDNYAGRAMKLYFKSKQKISI